MHLSDIHPQPQPQQGQVNQKKKVSCKIKNVN